jgi:hypothetical protein
MLAGHAKSLLNKKLALPQHQPCPVRWGQESLRSAGEHTGYSFEQTLDLFLANVGRGMGIKP